MKFIKGEMREVGIEIMSQSNQSFIISSADYVITNSLGEITDQGTTNIDGSKITIMYSALDTGKYSCEFTYRIVNEILKAKINMEVT